MQGIARINMLLKELGEVIGLPGLALDADGMAILAFGEDLFVLFGVDASDGSLVMTVPIPDSAGPKSREFLEAALVANFGWRETGGATLALDGATGPITLQIRLSGAETSLQQFERVLGQLVDTAGAWRTRVALGRIVEDISAAPVPNEGADAMFTVRI